MYTNRENNIVGFCDICNSDKESCIDVENYVVNENIKWICQLCMIAIINDYKEERNDFQTKENIKFKL